MTIHNDANLSETDTTSVDVINRRQAIHCKCVFFLAAFEAVGIALLCYGVARGWV